MALAVSGENGFKVAKHLGLHSTPCIEFEEAASGDWKRGGVLTFSSGLVTEPVYNANPTLIVGIAENDATGTTNANCRVIPAIPGTLIFSGHISDDITGNYTTVEANVGACYAILQDDTNKGWYIDASTDPAAIANARVRVVGFQDPVGTSNGRVYFTFLGVTYDTDGGANSVQVVSVWAGHEAAS